MYCVNQGILYESLPYHNVVFVGRDEKGQARYAFLRGIYDGGNPLRWNSQEVIKHIVFVFHQVGSVAEWRYMKRQSKP